MDRVIVGTGTTSTGDTVRISKAALDAGAARLLMLPPFYYHNASTEGLYSYFANVAERLGSDDPRILLYHIPQMSKVPIALSLARRLREAFPGVFVGIKDSGGDFEYTKSFIDAFDGFEAFSGSEPLGRCQSRSRRLGVHFGDNECFRPARRRETAGKQQRRHGETR